MPGGGEGCVRCWATRGFLSLSASHCRGWPSTGGVLRWGWQGGAKYSHGAKFFYFQPWNQSIGAWGLAASSGWTSVTGAFSATSLREDPLSLVKLIHPLSTSGFAFPPSPCPPVSPYAVRESFWEPRDFFPCPWAPHWSHRITPPPPIVPLRRGEC